MLLMRRLLSELKSIGEQNEVGGRRRRQMCDTQSGTDTSKFLSVARVRFTLSDCAALTVEPHLAATEGGRGYRRSWKG